MGEARWEVCGSALYLSGEREALSEGTLNVGGERLGVSGTTPYMDRQHLIQPHFILAGKVN